MLRQKKSSGLFNFFRASKICLLPALWACDEKNFLRRLHTAKYKSTKTHYYLRPKQNNQNHDVSNYGHKPCRNNSANPHFVLRTCSDHTKGRFPSFSFCSAAVFIAVLNQKDKVINEVSFQSKTFCVDGREIAQIMNYFCLWFASTCSSLAAICKQTRN